MSCGHERLKAALEFARLVESEERPDDATGWTADLRIYCDECDAPFGFKGMEAGVSPAAPMRSIDALEARLPLLSPAELALTGPFPPVRVRLPPEVVRTLEELSAGLPQIGCERSVLDAHEQGAGLFEVELDDAAWYDGGERVVVTDPDGWRLFAVVRGRRDRTLLLEGRNVWHPKR